MDIGSADIPELDDPTFMDDDAGIEFPPEEIVAFNELRSCADLVRMCKSDNINLHPEFQRDIVWNRASQTRFIDSLVKQLPIPSMCFAYDYRREEWIVIDGLQRMSAILNFLDYESQGKWTLSKLPDIDPCISGKKIDAFDKGKLRKLRERVENRTLPITVIRCDFSKEDDMEFIFMIFHRLNSGGMQLTNQEIRNCIYWGNFNDLLKDLDLHPVWRKLNHMKLDKNYRFVKQEIILRFFAFSDNWRNYEGKLTSFLNEYMHERRNSSESRILKDRKLFYRVMEAIDRISFGADGTRRSVAVIEALLVGIGANIKATGKMGSEKITARYREMRESEPFSEENLSRDISDKRKLVSRMETAINIFST